MKFDTCRSLVALVASASFEMGALSTSLDMEHYSPTTYQYGSDDYTAGYSMTNDVLESVARNPAGLTVLLGALGIGGVLAYSRYQESKGE